MKKSIISALIALCLSAPVLAADYYVVVPMPGKVASAPETPDPVENITVTLNTYTLPAGMVNTPYSFDLNTVLDVQGDAAYDAGSVAWSVVDGATPEGIALQADGKLAGTPTVKNEAGASFEVKATYKGKDGQQVYTIVVGGQVLQVTQISAGLGHTCVVTHSGGVKCWGWGGEGQLGDGSATNRITPVDVWGFTSGAASVTAGDYHTCAVTTSGSVKCWGADNFGQLGNDAAAVKQLTPVDVSGLTSGVASVSAGGGHTCAVTVGGGASCWGSGAYGELGNGGSASSGVPVSVSGYASSGISVIAAGLDHTCAVTTAGAARCWGRGHNGQLGEGRFQERATPITVSGLNTGAVSVQAGMHYSCALTTEGGVRCWGYNSSGQLGDSSTLSSSVPVQVYGLTSGVSAISATSASYHTCAVMTNGAAKCWGSNTFGTLGNNSTTNSSVPVDVYGLNTGVAGITVGNTHTCAAMTAGSAKCWGSSDRLGSNNPRSSVPLDVSP